MYVISVTNCTYLKVHNPQKSEDEEPEEDPDVKRMSEYFEDKYVSNNIIQ